jgi:uncharacterized protein (DUF305 family)
MLSSHARVVATTLVVLASPVACRTATRSAVQTSTLPAGVAPQPRASAASDSVYIARARADSARLPYTTADIQFMSGMIHHHAQAIEMSRMAPTHGASPAVRTLADRIINAQQDEIGTMQRWLRDRGQPAPDPFAPHASMADMPGMDMQHQPLMPGMLTPEQMQQLDAARDLEFDRLFLTFMLQHHRGAVKMVQDLFATPGAGQDELVFKFANDVNADQSTEIARMERMLATILFEKRAP